MSAMIQFLIGIVPKIIYVFVYLGESNSGGYALNSSALPEELEVNNDVDILNNTTLASFDPLHIGVNNLIGHRGFESVTALRHGMELAQGNYAKAHHWGNDKIKLVKCGQGGSKIEHWQPNAIYLGDTNCWQIFLNRTNAMKYLLRKFDIRIKVMLSIGINDAIANTAPAVFKTKLLTLISNIRVQLGDITIYITEIMPNNASYIAINSKILEVAASDSKVITINTINDDRGDANHWSYSGWKSKFEKFIEAGI